MSGGCNKFGKYGDIVYLCLQNYKIMSKPISKQQKKCDLYSSQLYHSRKRKHPKPEYTRQQFYNWLDTQPKFDRLYDEWVTSGFQRDLAPSVDRIRNNDYYKLDNLQIVTWKENRLKGYMESRLKRKSQPVLQYDLQGNFIKEWYSSSLAAKYTNILKQSIDGCVKYDIYRTAGGFQWKYKDSDKVIKDISNIVESFSFSANPVYQMDKDNNVLKEYCSFSAACRAIDYNDKYTTKIRDCCEGKRKTYKGFKWRYVDEKLNENCVNYLKDKADKKIVEQYDINGKYVATFSSPAEVADKLNILGVSYGCKTNNSLIGGFQWKYQHSDKEIKPHIDYNKEKQKPILQLTMDGEFVAEFECASEAAKSINKPIPQLRKRLQGYKKSYCGYIWKYK